MSPVTTHVLDTSIGRPAAGITVILFKEAGGEWNEIARGLTNPDGRVPGLLDKTYELQEAIYKLQFLTKTYFDNRGTATFYPQVEIIFETRANEHYHVPLLLSPFGYSTYRGS